MGGSPDLGDSVPVKRIGAGERDAQLTRKSRMKLRFSGTAATGGGADLVAGGGRTKPVMLGSLTPPSEGCSPAPGAAAAADGGASSGPFRPQPASAKAAPSAAITARRANRRSPKRVKETIPQGRPLHSRPPRKAKPNCLPPCRRIQRWISKRFQLVGSAGGCATRAQPDGLSA